jgi:hypothetical protein
MACRNMQNHHVGDCDRESQVAVHAQHYPLALRAKDGLANKVKDGSLGGVSQDHRVQYAPQGRGCVAWVVDSPGPFDELADTSSVGKRIGQQHDREHEQQSAASSAGKLAEDRQRGWPLQDALVDAQEPEGWKTAHGSAVGREQRDDGMTHRRIEQQHCQQQHHRAPLK